MTRMERKKEELEKLYEWRRTFLRQNDIMAMHKTQAKIDALEKEIIEMKREGTKETRYLRDILDRFSEEDKNAIYKSLLRINLLCDVVNEACEDAKSTMSKVGITDFSFKRKVEDLCRMSQEVASILVMPNNQILDDFIINDDEVVDGCMELANKYIETKILI